MNPRPRGYEASDMCLCRRARSLVTAPTSPDGPRSFALGLPLPLPRQSRCVSRTNPCTNLVAGLRGFALGRAACRVSGQDSKSRTGARRAATERWKFMPSCRRASRQGRTWRWVADEGLSGESAQADGPDLSSARRLAGEVLAYLVCRLAEARASSPIPVPDGYPDRGRRLTLGFLLPLTAGGGETDWTLPALQTAAASLSGPGTWLLVGMSPGGTGRRVSWRRT